MTCVVCPLCGLSVKHVDGESIHVTYDRHARDACDPSRKPEKKRCPVRGCKEKLSAVNAFECKRCRVKVCLKHRHADAHSCGNRSMLRNGGVGTFASSGALRKNANPWSFAKASGARAPLPTNRALSGSTTRNPREVCAQCGRSFSNLAALIAHAEVEHAAGERVRRNGGGGCETCPQCGAAFSDVTALVEHVERAHERKRKDTSRCRVS